MIIDILNTDLRGGAAVAALRQHRALLAEEVESRFWHSPKASRHPNEVESIRPLSWKSEWLHFAVHRIRLKLEKRRYISKRPKGNDLFTQRRRPTRTPFDPARLQGSVTHLHWIARWIDEPTFMASIPNGHPIVWTLHDMNPMTGGCHHADDCVAFKTACRSCPQLANSSPNDLASRAFQGKLRDAEDKNLHIVTPSRWLLEKVNQSQILRSAKSVQMIRNGLDLQVFSPIEKQKAKQKLGLPTEKTIIGFGAATLTNSRKGFGDLRIALARLRETKSLLGFGFGENSLPQIEGMPETTTTGYINDEDKQALIYSAMDFFVLPSWAENLPQTAVEAMACGTPVVAYDVGGIPEIVHDQDTGLLAEHRSLPSLAHQIQWMIDHKQHRMEMGTNARLLIESEFDMRQCVQRYLDLYYSLAGLHLQAA